MYDAMKRLEIRHFRGSGFGVEQVTKHAEVSTRTVGCVRAEKPIEDVDAGEAARHAEMGGPNQIDPFRERIEAWLTVEPEMQGIAILRRLRDEGYTGGKNRCTRH